MAITYEVRQYIGTVNKKWMEVVFSGMVERLAGFEYNRLKDENPSEYFELVKIEKTEDCLAFTANR